tara:strand:- start:2639 stop:3028 length:390 start_codon:yes stop_codon:yes gene_type:complete
MKRILVLFFCIHPFMFSETELYFINIENGDVLQNPILVQFGLRGKGVAPAGVDIENTGHHHLLINVDKIDLKEPIPASKNHIHFGGGQTETFLNLPAGQHSLQLLLGNKYHIPHSPAVISEKIKVTVTE